MLSEDKDDKKERKNENDEYLLTYSHHLEKRIKNLETERQLIKSETIRLEHEVQNLRNEINRLREPSLITGTIIDVLDANNERVIIKSSSGPDFVVKTSKTVKSEKLSPGMSVALNQSTFAIMEILPSKLDPFIKGMELADYIPDTSYNDVGGLDEQIQEVRETVELPLIKPELFKRVGIDPPKGILLHGPPGTGKTLLAKAVAHETKSTFIRVIGSELVQKFIGEGARYVREIFQLARQKSPTILLIDELDAIAAVRMEDSTSGDREVQRTMMQLLSELDGFDNRGDVKIIGATNRIDILDPALLRPGRFDRIIEFPIPDEKARKSIFKIHMRFLNIEENIDLKELVKLTEYATGADIKAICTEAGMFAIRKDSYVIKQNNFIDAIYKILKKKKDQSAESRLFI
ncbi:MAG: proteasome-activating nucleotidase [Candidatus Heimdallarchaeota archaeon]